MDPTADLGPLTEAELAELGQALRARLDVLRWRTPPAPNAKVARRAEPVARRLLKRTEAARLALRGPSAPDQPAIGTVPDQTDCHRPPDRARLTST